MTGAIADKSFATSLTPLWLVTFSLELELRLELKNAWIRVGAQGRSEDAGRRAHVSLCLLLTERWISPQSSTQWSPLSRL
jgi:hypothetical protein